MALDQWEWEVDNTPESWLQSQQDEEKYEEEEQRAGDPVDNGRGGGVGNHQYLQNIFIQNIFK